jgi:hypothetical protein
VRATSILFPLGKSIPAILAKFFLLLDGVSSSNPALPEIQFVGFLGSFGFLGFMQYIKHYKRKEL